MRFLSDVETFFLRSFRFWECKIISLSLLDFFYPANLISPIVFFLEEVKILLGYGLVAARSSEYKII